MPQLQNLVLTDRAATPVAHTFTPRDVIANVGTVEETDGTLVGAKTLSISLRKLSDGRARITMKEVFPVVVTETINGVTVPAVARSAYIDTTITFDPKSTTQERKDAIGMHQSAFDPSKVLVNDVVIGLQGVY